MTGSDLEKEKLENFNELLLSTSLDSAIPASLRDLTPDEIIEKIEQMEKEAIKVVHRPDRWDFAPKEQREEQERLEAEFFEVLASRNDIMADETIDDEERDRRLKARLDKLELLDNPNRNQPAEIDEEAYMEASKRYDEEKLAQEKLEAEVIMYKKIKKNIESMGLKEFSEVLISMDFGMHFGFSDIPFLELHEGYIDSILNDSINNESVARKRVEELFMKTNISNIPFSDKIYYAFINHLQGHKAIREVLYKKGFDEDRFTKFARVLIPIYNLSDSLPNNYNQGVENFYNPTYHAIIWRFPNGIILSNETETNATSDGEEVFRGSPENLYFEAGAEENAHSFYFQEKSRDYEQSEKRHRKGEITYHGQAHELNGLYGILAAYIAKYGSEDKIPKVTYDALMNVIASSVKQNDNPT